MDLSKMGAFILARRRQMNLTQRELADLLHLSDKTVSKWERGLGCPDVSILPKLCRTLNVDMEKMLCGDLSNNVVVGGNMKKLKYFICPTCGNLMICTGQTQISCCGQKLGALAAAKAEEDQKLIVQSMEDEWYLTSKHPMEKGHYITFVALATGDRLQIVKQYPEWDLQVRFPRRGRGMLLWHCCKHGLFYQYL